MLHEAFYPADKLGNKPSKIFYGFVEDSSLITLVVFDSQATTTSVLALTPENQAKLVYRLLKNHVHGVQADFIKVVFLRTDSISKLVGEQWSIQVNKHYVEERVNEILEQRKAHLGFFGRFFNNKPSLPFSTVTIDKKDLAIGLTENISLYNLVHLDYEQAKYLLQALKNTDYGDFNDILKG
ncbi:hypothetical protein AY606_15540 [Acinetobacter sp. SFB]|uniref:hypothetical protein n=1 Tax=Acinetobacter sp. SFB TaxID=1805634 RepID=UPI0007D7BEE2|nr:hypothetical protein [Acinetobacter sp. SFB]OAL80394.1 hypothetical protein AY606_15540 [Acinetobacter sp. SFB]